MTVRIIPLDDGQYGLSVEGEPDYVTALSKKDASDRTAIGAWLIVGFAVWNSPARNNAYNAVRVMHAFRGNCQLGLQLFDSIDEVAGWALGDGQLALPEPNVLNEVKTEKELRIDIRGNPHGSLLWIAKSNGVNKAYKVGPLTDEGIGRLIKIAFGK
jgi:hypothetical protein